MALTVTSTSISGNTLTINGTSTQSVEGTALAGQSFTITKDISAAPVGVNTITIHNSANDAATVTYTKAAPITESPNHTYALSAGAAPIIDATGHSWTLHDTGTATTGLVVWRDGVAAGFTQQVTKLFIDTHKIYQVNIAGNAWSWNGTTPWVGPVADPSLTWSPPLLLPGHVNPGIAGFWGVQTHITWNWSLAACYQKANWPTLISKLTDLGVKTVRNDIDMFSTDVMVDFINNYATPAGIKVIPTLLGDYTSTEAGSFTLGHQLGSAVSVALTGLVPFFEVGNETDSDCIISGHLGTAVTDYNASFYLNSRGFIRGIIAGIKAHDTTTPIIMGGIVQTHTAFLEMLWNGTQPDGGTTPNTVRWDVTASHFYINNNSSIDNPENFNGVNLLQKLVQFGKPVHINEYGANFSQYPNETAVATALTGANSMGCWYARRTTYNITYCAMYQLMDAAGQGTPTSDDEMNFGLVANDGSTNKGRYAAVKTYIAGHQ